MERILRLESCAGSRLRHLDWMAQVLGVPLEWITAQRSCVLDTLGNLLPGDVKTVIRVASLGGDGLTVLSRL